ncbi:MAG: hypothetical protein LBV36_06280 [Chromatiales bacterium]|nr:hypothetical protein [Chromatiales bacterium]
MASACSVLTPHETTTENPDELVVLDVVDETPVHDIGATPAEDPAHISIPTTPAIEEQLTEYANIWLNLSREAQRQELLEAEARYLKSAAIPDLIHYAMLYVLRPAERAGTTKRVRSDLRRYLESATASADTTTDDLMPIARVLLYLLDEREQMLVQLTSQIETLQRQLDDLKAIEEQLRDRMGPDSMQAPIQATPR